MRVVIHVKQGRASVAEAPPEVDVEIVDFDDLEHEDEANCTCCRHYGGTFPCEGRDCQCCIACAPD